jgi:hypothetical protein
MDFGPKARQQFLMFGSLIPINPQIAKLTQLKFFYIMKRRRRINMATYALPEDAHLPHWSSPLMVSSEKKPLLLRSVLHPPSLANGNVHTRRFVALSLQDFLLPWFALQVVA